MGDATNQLSTLDATAQAELVRTGEVSALELVDAAIARIERLNPQLNAVVLPFFAKARKQASGRLPDGPFTGVPMVLKDLGCETAGDPYYMGMRLLRDAGWTAPRDSLIAARLRSAGFVFLGKTNTPEIGSQVNATCRIFGQTRNPWDPNRSPGGTSGGSAAAVASGMVPIAHGNDGGGSIRIPAAACGLVGLKPSRWRIPRGPDDGDLLPTVAVDHVLTRSVRDTAAALDVLAAAVPGHRYLAPRPARPFADEVERTPDPLRIAVFRKVPAGHVDPDGRTFPMHPACLTTLDEVAALLGSMGHHVTEDYPPALDDSEYWQQKTGSLFVARMLDAYGKLIGRTMTAEDVEPQTWDLAETARSLSAMDYVQEMEYLQSYTRRIEQWWAEDIDLLLTPSMPGPAPMIEAIDSDLPNDIDRFSADGFPYTSFTSTWNVTGQPAISLPLGWTGAGLPIGVQFVASHGREDLLISLASQLEKARPWEQCRPAIYAAGNRDT